MQNEPSHHLLLPATERLDLSQLQKTQCAGKLSVVMWLYQGGADKHKSRSHFVPVNSECLMYFTYHLNSTQSSIRLFKGATWNILELEKNPPFKLSQVCLNVTKNVVKPS